MRNIPLFKALAKDAWIKPFLKHYKKTMIIALLLGFMTFFCAGALMFTSGFLISRSASIPENILLVYVPIVLTRAFGIGRPVFRYVERLVSHNWVLKMTSQLRLKLYNTLEKDAVFFKKHYSLGDVLGLLAEDINHIQNLYLRTIFPTIIAWILYIFVVIGLGVFSIPFACLMALLLFSVTVVLPLWSVVVNGARQEKEKQSKNELYTELTDNVIGVADWIFSQRGHEYVNWHDQAEKNLQDTQASLRKFSRRRDFLLQVIMGIVVVALLFWTSQQFPGNHGGAANWIAAFVLSVFPLVDAFSGLPDAAQETNIYKDSIKRLNDLPNITEHTTKKMLEGSLDINIEHLVFQYEEDSRKILDNLSLTIPQGEKLAVLGRSGSGKSTLASLIRGDLVPTSGSVQLAGVATEQIGDVISEYIGVIQQTPYLFHTTILNNLRIGNEQAEIAEVWEVLQRVGLEQLVKGLPDGLDTMVDEAGLRFSGGERHRMALARILLKDTPIVLLDEPTVGLDPITEQALIDTFFEQLTGKTIIWITHHLQGIEKMQRVVFIEDGQLEMSGTPAELAQTNSRYQKLKAIDEGKY
ncbi:thiol reductant ABC exporter subunit CydC [Tetragenococcus koreensis]|uniref:Cytochrome bd biosynthesis ABC transporter ATP-binding and permease components cydC n=1 Tax=Tetragenococcus koreensis TaxID=290335 RepID=A0AAN4UBW6_9ENTE|nr:thiol reductant ABC exporter subunit CydC [Tetragenococcus koreensis]GEQ49607.1 cytochrome bd biosynthesis ABC transporter ATP-binding and permease components cydC [Tetragenococcus koreensis]GEQ52053.1 cytochrome bd biosynthesis ABC transporter ATP-binding and permease components cydC [Tetragenococcus koreensis]GEQ54588.1 cytochrome bd biosynthesis ABC transporter ATP-binding and permease components cydC [Tetragenococcus koreensis]GEQ57055.1 cytochrome bd biosynthesis ABC transporter ATP-bin